MILNLKLMKNRKQIMNTSKQKTSFPKRKVENTEVDKPEKIMNM